MNFTPKTTGAPVVDELPPLEAREQRADGPLVPQFAEGVGDVEANVVGVAPEETDQGFKRPGSREIREGVRGDGGRNAALKRIEQVWDGRRSVADELGCGLRGVLEILTVETSDHVGERSGHRLNAG